jgi:hypothetical protein
MRFALLAALYLVSAGIRNAEQDQFATPSFASFGIGADSSSWQRS